MAIWNRNRKIETHRWARQPEDFATHVKVKDVKRFFKSQLIVMPGTNAIFIEGGMTRGELPPGEYVMDSISQRFKGLVGLQAKDRVDVILTDISPVDISVPIENLKVADGTRIGLTVRLTVQMMDSRSVSFFNTVMKGREHYSITELSNYFYGDVRDGAQQWLQTRDMKDLVSDLRTKEALQMHLEDHLEGPLGDAGLEIVRVRTVDFNTEAYDAKQRVKEKYYFQLSETEEKQGHRRKLQELIHENNNLDQIDRLEVIRVEQQKVDELEARNDVRAKARAAILAGKMDEVRSQQDFDNFMNTIDHENKLKQRERDALYAEWAAADKQTQTDEDDKERARQHAAALLELERDYERREAELKNRTNFSEEELKSQLRIERTRMEGDQELKNKQWEWERQRRQQEDEDTRRRREYEDAERRRKQQEEEERRMRLAELDEREAQVRQRMKDLERKSDLSHKASEFDEDHRQEKAELGLAMDALRQMKEKRIAEERARLELEKERAQYKFEQEMTRDKAGWEKDKFKLEQQAASEQAERQYELNRIEKMGNLGADQLIAMSPGLQAELLKDLKATEALKGMSAEQILAMSAENSAEIAKAFQEKFKAAAAGSPDTSPVVQEMYERMLREQKQHAGEMQNQMQQNQRDIRTVSEDARRETLGAMGGTTDKALDNARDISIAQSRYGAEGGNNASSVIITGSGGNPVQTVNTGSGQVNSSGGGTSSSGVLRCGNCQREISNDVNYCPFCGQKQIPG